MFSDKLVMTLDARISLVRSVCSHHRSSVLSSDTLRASSETSRFIRHTQSGTLKKIVRRQELAGLITPWHIKSMKVGNL